MKVVLVAFILLSLWQFPTLLTTGNTSISEALAESPAVKDENYVVQSYVAGVCCGATTFAFVNQSDILVLEKISGEVHLIHNGVFDNAPVLKENVTSEGEQGMLTIATMGKKVYLYFTESSSHNGPALAKTVYSYDWTGSSLVNKTLVKSLPQTQTYHNGGAMTFDRNGSLYIALGDAGRYGKLQNHQDGEPNDTGVIMRLVPPGQYYAMGIRNSFGLTIDPVTCSLWDTENGPDYDDEINIVPPKFNSGWDVIMGPANSTTLSKLPGFEDYVYHDPQFSWQKPVAPTGIAFANSEAFAKYNNSIFVGDFNNGNLYRFQLNKSRDGFVFTSPQLADKVANVGDSMSEILFGRGFNGITDVKFGPDGFLYLMSYNNGVLYRILPASMASDNQATHPIAANASPFTTTTLTSILVSIAATGGVIFWAIRRRALK